MTLIQSFAFVAFNNFTIPNGINEFFFDIFCVNEKKPVIFLLISEKTQEIFRL